MEKSYSLFRRRNFCTAGAVESGTELSLKTVVQSIHESPWLSALTDNRPQSANTAVCLLGEVSRAVLHETAHSGSYAEIRRDTGTVGGLSFSLCYFDTSYSPRLQKSLEFLCQATVDTAKFVAVVSVDGNKRSNRASVSHI